MVSDSKESEKKKRRIAAETDENLLQLYVCLPSGQSVSVELPRKGCCVGDLKMAAQRSLEKGFLRLARLDGRLLKPSESLQDAALQNGEYISAVVRPPKIAATRQAFALWCVGGWPDILETTLWKPEVACGSQG
eukprot:Skav230508  [mRNA]  locus=scaffold2083:226202:228426:+ [translate_table: standard]